VASKASAGSAPKVVVPMKRPRSRHGAVAVRVPRARTIALLFGLLASAVGLYIFALESSVFAVKTIAVAGAPPSVLRAVQGAEAKFEGRSLVGLSTAAVEQAALSVPWVRSAQVDRAFPSTLRIRVRRELPLAVLRRGPDAWLVATSGKVLKPFALDGNHSLPRIWVARSVDVVPGAAVGDRDVRTAVSALNSLRGRGSALRIIGASTSAGELQLVTSSGVRLRFGDASQAPLKLAVAAKIVPRLPSAPAGSVSYLDVSVPESPVSGTSVVPAVKPHA
jgi:cell division protein FtsQ